jgi:hypothetical protein
MFRRCTLLAIWAVFAATTYVQGQSVTTNSEMWGFAEVIRAGGDRNLTDAKAATQAEETVSRKLDNAVKRTETFFQMRDANQAAHYQGMIAHLEYKKQVREYKKQNGFYDPEKAARIANLRAPKPWTQYPSEVATQERYLPAKDLLWPALLQSPEFDRERKAIDHLMALRCGTPTNFAHEHLRITQQIDAHAAAMQAKLQPMAKGARATYYMQAKRFLDGMTLDVNAPVAPAGFVDPTNSTRVAAR